MTGVTRRGFLAGTGLAALTAGCRGGSGGGTGGDLDAAATFARMEQVLIDTYGTSRGMAVEGRLGAAIPQAVVEYLTTARGHHQEHLNSWNAALTAGGRAAIDAPDARLRAVVDRAVIRVTDIPALVAMVLRLEDYASQTYLAAIATLTAPEHVRTAGRILVVDQQHQAVLRYMLGLPPAGSGLDRAQVDLAPADPRLGLVGP